MHILLIPIPVISFVSLSAKGNKNLVVHIVLKIFLYISVCSYYHCTLSLHLCQTWEPCLTQGHKTNLIQKTTVAHAHIQIWLSGIDLKLLQTIRCHLRNKGWLQKISNIISCPSCTHNCLFISCPSYILWHTTVPPSLYVIFSLVSLSTFARLPSSFPKSVCYISFNVDKIYQLSIFNLNHQFAFSLPTSVGPL